jgi:UDP-glucose 4-epimerase
MNILISGGNGYIGSCLIQHLLQLNIVPDLIVRNNKNVTDPRIQVYICDISKPLAINPAKSYDLFIHLASANDIDSGDPEKALLFTTLGTRNCLDFCKKQAIERLIYFSTFQVLGRVEADMNEDSLCKPANDYGLTHLFAEQYVQMYRQTSGLRYIIVRPTNIFGAPMNKTIDRWSLVPNCFCKEAFEKQTITLLSSGKQLRDFLNLHDLARLTIALAKNFDAFSDQLLNLSSGHNYSILEIAMLTKQQYEKTFDRPCQLLVKSDQPLFGNACSISQKNLEPLNFTFSPKDSIIDEINFTFYQLKR